MEHLMEEKVMNQSKKGKKQKHAITLFFKVTDWLFEKMSVALMAYLVIAVMVSVILRYFFNISFIWAEEMILFTFIASTYFGIIICVKEDEHIAIDFFVEKLPGVSKKILQTLISVIGIITLLWIAKSSLGWIETVGKTLSSGMKVPYKYIYSWMPISFSICALYEFRKMLSRWLKTNQEGV